MITRKVIGADACNGRLVCISLDSLPSREEVGQIYREKSQYFDVDVSAAGLSYLLSLKPDVLVLEPTGVNYIKFWTTKCAEAGVKIALVGHKQSREYRNNLRLPDKDDEADALALACYYLEHHADPIQFVRIRDGITSQLRDAALRLKHIDRIQSPLVNRLKQDLAWAMPEVSGSVNAILFWKWLAGDARSNRYDALAVETCGLGITQNMQAMAKLLVDLWRQKRIVESQMLELLNHPQFDRDRQVMKKYYLPNIAIAILIGQYYPLSNFLGADGTEIMQLAGSRRTATKTLKPVSLRRFRKALGVAPVRESSGKSPTKTRKAGSRICRCQLWLWSMSAFERKKSKTKSATPAMCELNALWLKIRAEKHIKVARSTFASKFVERLFYDLLAGK
jgi:Transposase IS116/IS110/IS902 family